MAQPTSHLAPSPWTPSPESGLPFTRSDKEPVEFVATILKIREESLHGRVVRPLNILIPQGLSRPVAGHAAERTSPASAHQHATHLRH